MRHSGLRSTRPPQVNSGLDGDKLWTFQVRPRSITRLSIPYNINPARVLKRHLIAGLPGQGVRPPSRSSSAVSYTHLTLPTKRIV